MPFAYWLTTLGQAEVLLPIAALASLWLAASGRRSVAARWLSGLLAAGSLTIGSKIAFIGWGVGIAAIDFTGFSGHAMLSASIYPVLFVLLGQNRKQAETRQNDLARSPWRSIAAISGYLLAAMVAASRITVGAHSWSEALAGFLIGALVSGLVLQHRWPAGRALPHRGLILAITAYLLILPSLAPASHSHSLITSLALKLAGHNQPYTRPH